MSYASSSGLHSRQHPIAEAEQASGQRLRHRVQAPGRQHGGRRLADLHLQQLAHRAVQRGSAVYQHGAALPPGRRAGSGGGQAARSSCRPGGAPLLKPVYSQMTDGQGVTVAAALPAANAAAGTRAVFQPPRVPLFPIYRTQAAVCSIFYSPSCPVALHRPPLHRPNYEHASPGRAGRTLPPSGRLRSQVMPHWGNISRQPLAAALAWGGGDGGDIIDSACCKCLQSALKERGLNRGPWPAP